VEALVRVRQEIKWQEWLRQPLQAVHLKIQEIKKDKETEAVFRGAEVHQ
jgi:hypothetical protein